MKKVSIKLVISSIIVVLVIQGVFGFIGVSSALEKSNEAALVTSQKSAQIASSYISSRIQEVMRITYEIGCANDYSSFGLKTFEKQTKLDLKIEKNGYASYDLTDDDGKSIFNDQINYEGTPQFVAVMKSETYMSAPEPDENGNMIINFYAPIWTKGMDESAPSGMVRIGVDSLYIASALDTLSVTENGTAYIVDENGYTIFDTSGDVITDPVNIEEKSFVDTRLSDLAELHKKVRLTAVIFLLNAL